MVVRSSAAPPTPWSKNLAEPQIDETAYVHSFSNLIGDVTVGPEVLVAPGTSIRADEGTPFYIGPQTSIQDGVVIHGLERGSVLGRNNKEYSVWIGAQACIAHMALIHGPAFVGDRCFVGFRSTIFNARLGDGCIVMMHALVQDVVIPSGKYVPSGAVITTQQQADQLPDVTEKDRLFAAHVVEVNEALRGDYHHAEADHLRSVGGVKASQDQTNTSQTAINQEESVGTMSVNGDIRGQLQGLLNQGCAIGVEHANARRFKTKSWLTGPVFNGTRADQVIGQLNQFLADHSNEYVRLIGVNPQAKSRVAEVIVQRPGAQQPVQTASSGTTGTAIAYGSNGVGAAGGDWMSQVRALLSQGHSIGLEYADQRHFRAKSWKTCPLIANAGEREVLAQINQVLADHTGEYVRLIGVDTQAKSRVSQEIIQRPDGPVSAGSQGGSTGNGFATVASGSLSAEVVQQVRSLLSQGYQIGTEHADKRRFRTKSWQSCAPINSSNEREVLSLLEACVQDHAGEYVRLIGIDANAKARVAQTIIQRPEDKPQGVATAAAAPRNGGTSFGTAPTATATLDSQTVQQVRSLLAQGYQIGTEHADQRRFRTKSWQSCAPINSSNEREVLSLLEACVQDHAGEYVRLIGIDTNAKRRVLEAVIQRP